MPSLDKRVIFGESHLASLTRIRCSLSPHPPLNSSICTDPKFLEALRKTPPYRNKRDVELIHSRLRKEWWNWSGWSLVFTFWPLETAKSSRSVREVKRSSICCRPKSDTSFTRPTQSSIARASPFTRGLCWSAAPCSTMAPCSAPQALVCYSAPHFCLTNDDE